MTTLSLCMIVRDEAEFLPQFLTKVAGVWDQLVALDTGSTDDTKSILRAAGAEVYDFDWADDFSAARNACLQYATQDFILVLDADEMPHPGFAEEVRACIAKDQVGAASIKMQSAMRFGHTHQSNILRLYRRDFNPTYRFRVHEEAATSVQLSLIATGLDYVHLTTPVEHLGYSPEVCHARNKKIRDTKLLWTCVQEDPHDLYSLYKLLEQGRFHKDEELTHKALQLALVALDGVTDTFGLTHFLPEMVVLMADALRSQNKARADALLFYWAERLPDSPSLLHARGQVRETTGEIALAASDFQQCLNLDGKAYNQQLTSVRPRLGLARIALAQADINTARAHIDASLKLAPEDPEALLAHAFLASMPQPESQAQHQG